MSQISNDQWKPGVQRNVRPSHDCSVASKPMALPWYDCFLPLQNVSLSDKCACLEHHVLEPNGSSSAHKLSSDSKCLCLGSPKSGPKPLCVCLKNPVHQVHGCSTQKLRSRTCPTFGPPKTKTSSANERATVLHNNLAFFACSKRG